MTVDILLEVFAPGTVVAFEVTATCVSLGVLRATTG